MKKIILILAVMILILIGGFFWLNQHIYDEKRGPTDYKEAAFLIDNKSVTLDGGVTKYFGNLAKGDLNGDSIPDLAFIITQQPGGSGTFYYVVAAIQTPNNTYNGTHAVLLGDRIAPQTTEIRDGILVVNYADRAPTEPMTTQPSVGKSIWLKLDPASMQFGEVVQDFEGEADPNRMNLQMKKWNWASATAFSITFGPTGQFSATTDCNSVGGQYSAVSGKLTFSNIFMTKMFCEGSRENEFIEILENTTGYHFTSRGELFLNLKSGNSAVFK